MNLLYVLRSTWGASATTETFIKNRMSDSAVGKDTAIVHHDGAIDLAGMPNRRSYSSAVARMKRLEVVRPDLGPLPYSFNFAVSENLSTVYVFQGRGATKRGAHTASYNMRGVGLGILGNFDTRDDPARDALLEGIQQFCIMLKTGQVSGEALLPNLGKNRSPKGWEFWGHRDGPNVAKTCPGNTLYPSLASMTFTPAPLPVPDPGDDMSLKETLVDLAFAAGWAEPDTQAARQYWYGVDPNSPAWNDMRNAIIRGATSLRGGGMTSADVSQMISGTRLAPPS